MASGNATGGAPSGEEVASVTKRDYANLSERYRLIQLVNDYADARVRLATPALAGEHNRSSDDALRAWTQIHEIARGLTDKVEEIDCLVDILRVLRPETGCLHEPLLGMQSDECPRCQALRARRDTLVARGLEP